MVANYRTLSSPCIATNLRFAWIMVECLLVASMPTAEQQRSSLSANETKNGTIVWTDDRRHLQAASGCWSADTTMYQSCAGYEGAGYTCICEGGYQGVDMRS
jgi:hypothetical protein